MFRSLFEYILFYDLEKSLYDRCVIQDNVVERLCEICHFHSVKSSCR